MKNYYQRQNSDYRLAPKVYQKTVKEMQMYKEFLVKIERIESKSEDKITENDIEQKIMMRRICDLAEKALKQYVIDDYQETVWQHVIEEKEYEELARTVPCFHCLTYIKEQTRAFVFGFAELKGETYKI